MSSNRNPETTARRCAIVTEWNRGEKSMAQIGADFGMTRNSIARYLFEARAMGTFVAAVTRHTGAVRSRSALRTRLGDIEFFRAMCRHTALMRAAKARRIPNPQPRTIRCLS